MRNPWNSLKHLLSLSEPQASEQSLNLGKSKNEQYDRETIEVMRRCMAPDSVGIDGGAHAGSFLKEMTRIAPRGAHYAFEPIPHYAKKLGRRYRKLRIFPCAIGNQSGRSSFHHVVNAPAYSGLMRREYDRPDPRIETIQVDVVKLDDVVDDGDKISFIKLDLEGGEYHALLGALETVRRGRPIVVFEAGARSSGHYGVTADMIFDLFLEKLDYSLTTMRLWLESKAGMSKEEFLLAYKTEFYFLAFPKNNFICCKAGDVGAGPRRLIG